MPVRSAALGVRPKSAQAAGLDLGLLETRQFELIKGKNQPVQIHVLA
jgi:hypothetical protein